MVDTIRTEFGMIEIDGKKFESDVCITPDGTIEKRPKAISKEVEHFGHTPLSQKELKAILEKMGGVEKIIVGTGQNGALPINREALQYAKTNEIELVRKITPKAIEDFLEKKEEHIGAIFHITC